MNNLKSISRSDRECLNSTVITSDGVQDGKLFPGLLSRPIRRRQAHRGKIPCRNRRQITVSRNGASSGARDGPGHDTQLAGDGVSPWSGIDGVASYEHGAEWAGGPDAAALATALLAELAYGPDAAQAGASCSQSLRWKPSPKGPAKSEERVGYASWAISYGGQ